MRVIVYREYEVDETDPDVAEEVAYDMFERAWVDGEIIPCDFNTAIV